MAVAVATSMQRGVPGTKFRPSQSTPSATHAAASSAVVIPQTLMRTLRRFAGRDPLSGGSQEGQPAYSILSSSLTLAITCGAWMGLVM